MRTFIDTSPGGDWTWPEVAGVAVVLVAIIIGGWAELAAWTGGFGA